MENNNRNNNYVSPEKVNLENANLNEASDILNRERENIVSATLQVNNSIDEDTVKKTNEAIKVKEKNPFINALIIIISLILGGVLVFFIVKFSRDFIEAGSPSTTTTTTTKFNLHSRVSAYLNDFTKVRKFETSDRIILLLPSNYDLKDNQLFYLDIMNSESGILKEDFGTYSVTDDTLTLNKTNEVFNITEGGISTESIMLNMFDTEYKYYTYKSDEVAFILLMNGTLKNETSLLLTSNKDTTSVTINRFEENAQAITLSNGLVFQKENMDIRLSEYLLKLAE